MADAFTDHFGPIATGYAQHRPRYPAALFTWLAAQCHRRAVAWDCATGSGKAAASLAGHFGRVIATDASAVQIAAAQAPPGVEYVVARAERCGLASTSVDLISVAQALHWFDVDGFHREAQRVLLDGGVLAEWSYGKCTVEDPTIDAVVDEYHHHTLRAHWPAERVHVETGYRDLPFPFHPVVTPHFEMTACWTLDRFIGYLRSWSATARFAAAGGSDAIGAMETMLAAAWGAEDSVRTIRWPLCLRVGRPRGR